MGHQEPSKKQRYRQAGKRLVILAAVVGCVSLLAGRVSLEEFEAWSQSAALLSVGLQRPEGGAQALSERLDRKPAAGSDRTTSAAGTTSTTSASTAASSTTTTTAKPTTTGTIPPRGPNGGLVKELKMGLGNDFVQGVAVKNGSGKTLDIAKEITIKPALSLKKTTDPQVLIVHTHTTESYMPYDAGYYNDGDTERTTDESKNVCAVGEALAARLRAAGIQVVHDTTVHDSPKYTGAYTRSEATVKKNLEKYPSIQVVLDIHRDGIMVDKTTKAKPTVVINGKKAAQVMIIAGVVSTSALPHPNWQDNLHFALQWQKAAVAEYRELMRPVSLVASRYNQHLSKGYLLLEFGSEGNTLAEAVYSAELLGNILAQVLASYTTG